MSINKYIYKSIKGGKRIENQDSFLIIDDNEFSFFAIFDGVGGALNGKKASNFAKKFIKNKFSNYLGQEIRLKEMMFDLNNDLVSSYFKEAFTTYCFIFMQRNNNEIYYSWLGDSRIYEITNQFMESITIDDSINKNVINKFLGDDQLSINDFRLCTTPKENKYFLLCTDGFYNILESNKLAFFKEFNKKYITKIKIDSLVNGLNEDDSTYIFIK